MCLSVTNKNVTMSQDNVVAEAQPLCTGAELDLGDKRFWSYKKRIALLLCQAKGESAGLCPTLVGFGEEFYGNGSRVGLLLRIRVCSEPVFF